MIRHGLVLIALLIVPNLSSASPARADEAAAESSTEVVKPEHAEASDKPAEKVVPANPVAPAVAPICPLAHSPVYVADWGRLAALTQSDATVFERAELWAKQREQTDWMLAAGLFLGGGAAVLGTVNRLGNESWTSTTKWGVAGGAGVALVSLLAALAFSPDRDDFYTVINQWNLRHPDRLLAP